MYTPIEILESARTIRPFLPTLLDAETAQSTDQQLADLLNQPAPADKATIQAILDLLRSHPATQDWLTDFLDAPTQKGGNYQSLPGFPALQSAQKYICPLANDCNWYREDSSPVPLCPTHLVPLIPAQS